MSYYYQSHIRNLQAESLLERKKIAAELHEKKILQQSNLRNSHLTPSPQKSRRIQDRETAAYLQRSRLSAELSAMRSRAEGSMNRSRLETAFELRKENQRAIEELDKMEMRHALLRDKSLREEYEANMNMIQSQRRAEETYYREKALCDLTFQQNQAYEQEKRSAVRLDLLSREKFDYPFYY